MASDIVMFQDVKEELGQVLETAVHAALLTGFSDVPKVHDKKELGEVVEVALRAELQSVSEGIKSISEQIRQDVQQRTQALTEALLPAVRTATAEISASITAISASIQDVREELGTLSKKHAATSATATTATATTASHPANPANGSLVLRGSNAPRISATSAGLNDSPLGQQSQNQGVRRHQTLNNRLTVQDPMLNLPFKSRTLSLNRAVPQVKEDFAPRMSGLSARSEYSHGQTSQPLTADEQDDLEMEMVMTSHHTCGYLAGRVTRDRPIEKDRESLRQGRASSLVPKMLSGEIANSAGISTFVKSIGFRQNSERIEVQRDSEASKASSSASSSGKDTRTQEEQRPDMRWATSFHGLLPQGTKGHMRHVSDFSLSQLGRYQKRAHALVKSRHFEMAVAAMLILNAAYIGIQVDYMARNTEKEQLPLGFKVVGWIFCFLFLVELALRVFVFGWRFFCVSDWKWNVFDAIVVSLQVAEELTDIIVDVAGGSSIEYTNFTAVRVLRVLRLVRVFRFMRILRLIRELHTMVGSITGSLRSFAWTIALLTLMIFIVAVYITQLVVDHARTEAETYAESEMLQKYWGSLGSSALSLFQALTGGQDWDELLTPLQGVTDWEALMAMLFAAYIAFAMFVMLNLVTGIFVDSAQTNVREDRDLDLVNRVRDLFLKTDDDNSGYISYKEFHGQLHSPEMEEYFKVIDLDMSEAPNLFNILDVRGSGFISAEEFVNGCLRLRGAARAFDFMVHIHHSKRIYQRLLADVKSLVHQTNVIAQEMNIDSSRMHRGETSGHAFIERVKSA